MKRLARRYRIFTHACFIVVFWSLTSCSYEGLPELTLQQVSVVEWPRRPFGGDRGLVLLVELREARRSDDSPYPASYVQARFCRDEQPKHLIALGTYKRRALRDDQSSGTTPIEPGFDIGPLMFVPIDIKRLKNFAKSPDVPDYDLRHDDRDICLRTGAPGMFTVETSNTVRIPREVVARAIHKGIQPVPDLIPFFYSR